MPKIYLTPSFLESLSKLSKNNHHRANQTILKMMADINLSGLRFHKVHDFTSISSGMDLRIICNPWKDGYVINYVDHHDAAYLWAKNHTLICNQADSFLEFLPHTEGQVVAQKTTAQTPVKNDYGTTIADRLSEQRIPELLLRKIQTIDSEDTLLETIQDFSPHLQEIILNAATGATTDQIAMEGTSRVVVINDDEELERALKYPLDHWRLFLHPMQADIINQDYLKKIAIVGGPGTGKTIVLVHRAVNLFKEGKSILFITKTKKLAKILLALINKLIPKHDIIVSYFPEGNEPPDYWVRGNELGKLKSNTVPPYKLRLMLTSEWKYRNNEVSRIDHILFDEAQDLYNSVELNWIRDLLKLNIGMTFSIDCNQTVYPSYPKEIITILDTYTITKFPLNYCYRSTKEILKYAKEISEHAKNIHKIILSHKKEVPTEKIDTAIASLNHEMHRVSREKPFKGTKKSRTLERFRNSKKDTLRFLESRIKILETDRKQQLAAQKTENIKTKKMFSEMPRFSNYPTFYGLTGQPVSNILTTEKDFVADLSKEIKKLKKDYDTMDIAILVPNEKNVQTVKTWVPEIEITTFKQAKGCEWFAGIVIIDELIIKQNQLDSLPTLNSSNALYVAVTRFREKVTIVAVKSSKDFKLETEKIK